MTEFNKPKLLKEVLEQEPLIEMETVDVAFDIGQFFGNQQGLMKQVYAAYSQQLSTFEFKPPLGAKLLVTFNWENQVITLEKSGNAMTLSHKAFLRWMGLIDLVYAPILPNGSVVEIDCSLLSPPIRKMFEESKLGALLMITGRKVSLMEGFEQYAVDYLGILWPLGMIPGMEPVFISNMMIKRVVFKGYVNGFENKLVNEAIYPSNLIARQISSAFMTTEEAIAYYEALEKVQVN